MSAQAVILIPGIKGSQLINVNTPNFHPMWRDVRFNVNAVEDLELTDYFEGQQYEETMDVLIERGSVEGLAYKEFLEDLDVGGLPKFYFSYDWRKSNRWNAEKLNEFIEMLKVKSRARFEATEDEFINKVNIVTHSMGNHICRFYIKDYGFDSIHKIVFAAPPFLGSLAMINAMIKGQGMFKGVKKKLREIVRTFPGAIELIPRYKYAAMFDDETPVDFFNKDDWQGGIISIGSSDEKRRRLSEKFLKNLKQGLKDVNDLDTWLDELDEDQRKRMLVIVRDEFKTDQAMRVIRSEEQGGMTLTNTVEIDKALVSKQGDGVVPHASSCCYHNEMLTLAIEDSIRYDDDSHAFFMTEERVQDLVGWFFDDNEEFNFRIPGNSIKRVVKVKTKLDRSSKLREHVIEKE